MKINYDVDVEPISNKHTGRPGKWMPIINDFIQSDKQNICFEFETKKERTTAYNSIFQGFIQRKKIKGLAIVQRGLKLYVIKEDKQ